jgi:hypothetical protein
MISNLDSPEWELRNEILKRNHDIHPNRANILDRLGDKWSFKDNAKMRQDIGTAATKIRDAAEVIAESEKHDPWQVAESMIQLRDEIQNYLVHFAIATGEMDPPYDFSKENDQPANEHE